MYLCPVINSSPDYLDIFYKSSTIVIAVFNVGFAVYIFWLKNKKDDSTKEHDRKIDWFKVLILDHNLKHFYLFFENLEVLFIELKTPNLTDIDKQKINDKIGEQFILLRHKFLDTLLAIDIGLYNTVINRSDLFETYLTESIFDPGINLSHKPKFDQILTEPLTTTKTDLLTMLFSYRG